MIKTMFTIRQFKEKEPPNNPSVLSFNMPPLERLKNFSFSEFEDFIAEWAISCVKPNYNDVYKIGGTGDKGIDVIAENKDMSYDFFQCKHYKNKLQPSDYWLEFGKLCYFTYKRDIPLPKNYYIIASSGLSPSMIKLLSDKKKLCDNIKKNWDKYCSEDLKKNEIINLNNGLSEYINNFNFSIIKHYSINKIINEYMNTNYFYFRFGGIKKPIRCINIETPKVIKNVENRYVTKILEAYSQEENKEITIENIKEYKKYHDDLNARRAEYYSAESLKRNIRDIFTTENEFDLLKNEMFYGLKDFIIFKAFKNGFNKLVETLHEATKVNLSKSRVDNDLHFIGNLDKKGICHHLVNENRIDWRV